MIDRRTLTIGWINEVSAKNRKADKILVEKVIRALLLLEGLAKIDLDFVFKGGTALMLLLGSSRRLSIDIDIILPKKPENLETLFQKLTKLHPTGASLPARPVRGRDLGQTKQPKLY